MAREDDVLDGIGDDAPLGVRLAAETLRELRALTGEIRRQGESWETDRARRETTRGEVGQASEASRAGRAVRAGQARDQAGRGRPVRER